MIHALLLLSSLAFAQDKPLNPADQAMSADFGGSFQTQQLDQMGISIDRILRGRPKLSSYITTYGSITFATAGRGITWADGTISTSASGTQGPPGPAGPPGAGEENTYSVSSKTFTLDVLTKSNLVVSGTSTVNGNAFSVGASTFNVISGKVGVGTAAQDATLHVKGTDGVQTVHIQPGAGQAQAILSVQNSGGTADYLSMAVSGNIGINDSGPDAQLEIVSKAAPANYVLAVSSQNDILGTLWGVLGNGSVVSYSSVNASAFFGDGSHLTGISASASYLPNDVRAYGAVGDGTTDDTTAIQNAVNALANTGSYVLFSTGIYKISREIGLPSSSTLVAYGATIRQTSPGASVFSATGTITDHLTNISISGFNLIGAETTVHQWAARFFWVDKINFENNRVSGAYMLWHGENAVYYTYVSTSNMMYGSRVINNEMVNDKITGGDAAIMVRFVENIVIEGNILKQTTVAFGGVAATGSSGIEVYGGNSSPVDLPDDGSVGVPIDIYRLKCANASITNNSITGGAGGVLVSMCRDVSVTGNSLQNVGEGLWVGTSVNVIFSGNAVSYYSYGSNYRNWEVQGIIQNVAFDGNVFIASMTGGSVFIAPEYSTKTSPGPLRFTNNLVYMNNGNAGVVNAIGHFELKGNTFYNCALTVNGPVSQLAIEDNKFIYDKYNNGEYDDGDRHQLLKLKLFNSTMTAIPNVSDTYTSIKRNLWYDRTGISTVAYGILVSTPGSASSRIYIQDNEFKFPSTQYNIGYATNKNGLSSFITGNKLSGSINFVSGYPATEKHIIFRDNYALDGSPWLGTVPTDGTTMFFSTGSVILSSAPSATNGGYGWVNVAEGAPGTWKPITSMLPSGTGVGTDSPTGAFQVLSGTFTSLSNGQNVMGGTSGFGSRLNVVAGATSGIGGVYIGATDPTQIALDIDSAGSFRQLYVRGTTAHSNFLGPLNVGSSVNAAPALGLYVQGNSVFSSSVTGSAFFGDGSGLTGIIAGSESNTYTSSKTFTQDVLMLGQLNVQGSSATVKYGIKAATATFSSSALVGATSGLGTNTMDVRGSLGVGTYGGTTAGPSNGMIVSGSVGIGDDLSLTPGNPKVSIIGPVRINAPTDITFAAEGKMQASSMTFVVNATTFIYTSNGYFGLGTTSPQGYFHLVSPDTTTSLTTALYSLYVPGFKRTYTGASSISGGSYYTNYLGAPTFKSSGAGGLSFSNAGTLYISGPPTAQNNITFTSSSTILFGSGVDQKIEVAVNGSGGNGKALTIEAGDVDQILAADLEGGDLILKSGLGMSLSGTAGFDGNIILNANPKNNRNTSGYINLAPYGGNVGVSTLSPVGLFTIGNGTFTTLASGYIGIGNSDPKSKLHISSGTLIIDGDNPLGLISNSSVTASAFFGDGSHLTGISGGGETNTYTSSKTFTSDVLGKSSITASAFTILNSTVPLIHGVQKKMANATTIFYSSNTSVNITGLDFTLTNNTSYFFQYDMVVQSTLAAAGVWAGINRPAGSTITWTVIYNTAYTGATLGSNNGTTIFSAAAGASVHGVNVDIPLSLWGTIITGNTGGIMQPVIKSETYTGKGLVQPWSRGKLELLE